MKSILLLCALLSTSVMASFYSHGTKVPATKVDVLVLMDNSGSMANYKNKVGNSVAALIRELQYNSINLGLITNGPFQDGERVFRTTPIYGDLDKVLAGLAKDINNFRYDGPAVEEFYSAILKTTQPEYSDFYRDGADVVLFVITDEDEERVKSPMNTLDFIREFKSRLNISKVTMNLLTESKKCNPWGLAIEEKVLFEAVRALGGQVYDLCPQDPQQ